MKAEDTSTDTSPIVRLRGVDLERDGTPILSGVDWSIERGQHWALLGANGSGKTTLLKVMTGYEWPTRGRVEVLGRVFGEANLRELRRHIGWVSSSLASRMHEEESGLAVAVSGFEASIGRYREFSEAEWRRAGEALAEAAALGVAQRPWRVMSQGERQRVLIARALVGAPELLILDEPCAGLDPAAREHFLDDIERLAGRAGAPTVLLVTHHVEEIRGFMTHALVLAGGRVLAAGPKHDVLNTDTLAAAFAASCVLVEEDGKYQLTMG